MADLYGTTNNCSFSSSSSLESEDMSSFLQSFLNNPATKEKYGQPSQISTDFLDSDQRFSDLSSFYSTEANQVKFSPENGVAGFDFGCQRRRSRINEKLKALQTLVPNSNKVCMIDATDKASMLDEAIEYLKQVQLKVQLSEFKKSLNTVNSLSIIANLIVQRLKEKTRTGASHSSWLMFDLSCSLGYMEFVNSFIV
ncbi:hypothetical protein SSX86_003776 [Deinandra increscens subsp. villosa]|uniref:BHLH domain-containing protein n=1 Tax=Deinandra increscens subsp. villosa TaxID=3103831 RepID=A0AAP0DLY7_9ASTR